MTYEYDSKIGTRCIPSEWENRGYYSMGYHNSTGADNLSRNTGVKHQGSRTAVVVVKAGVVKDQARFGQAIATQHQLAKRIPGYEAITELTPASRIKAAKDEQVAVYKQPKVRAAEHVAENVVSIDVVLRVYEGEEEERLAA